MRHIQIRRSGLLKQKWSATFIADNNLALTRTTEHYHNLGDLKAMLTKYFPDWQVQGTPLMVTRLEYLLAILFLAMLWRTGQLL